MGAARLWELCVGRVRQRVKGKSGVRGVAGSGPAPRPTATVTHGGPRVTARSPTPCAGKTAVGGVGGGPRRVRGPAGSALVWGTGG